MVKTLTKPPTGTSFEAFCKRLEWLKEKTGVDISPDEKKWASDIKGVIENPIGFVKLPLAIAGPLKIKGDFAQGEFLVPLCTVEGTLSMSLNMGAFITSLAGGIKVRHLRQSLCRSPIFLFQSLDEIKKFEGWIQEHFVAIKEVAESTTRFGKLLTIETYILGSNIILDFVFTTAEAAGQNMTTIATGAACQWIQNHYRSAKPFHYLLESNFSGDKNPAYRTLIKGRGHSVTAEVTIPEKFIKKFGGCDAISACKNIQVSMAASQMAGIASYNLHTVNALTAIYLATGQDTACVVENAFNTLHVEVVDKDLKFSLYIPSLTVGTVGGGTSLEDQNKNLQILNCSGPDSAKKFAEILAASCLAIEISLAGAISTQDFIASHLKYSRMR